MIPPPAFHTVREHLAKPFHRLALPCAHLVRMNLVLRGNLLQRPIAPKRFQRDLRFQLPENLRLFVIAYPSSVGGIHLKQLPDFPGPPQSAISIARNFIGRKRNFTGESFWARGYFVSTVGLEEEVVREYIRRQEQEEQRLEQLNMPWERKPPSGGS